MNGKNRNISCTSGKGTSGKGGGAPFFWREKKGAKEHERDNNNRIEGGGRKERETAKTEGVPDGGRRMAREKFFTHREERKYGKIFLVPESKGGDYLGEAGRQLRRVPRRGVSIGKKRSLILGKGTSCISYEGGHGSPCSRSKSDGRFASRIGSLPSRGLIEQNQGLEVTNPNSFSGDSGLLEGRWIDLPEEDAR